MQSVMQHSFAQIPSANVGRSSFNRSSGHKTAIDADYLYPLYIDLAMPGDTMKMRANYFARMATPIYPVMDNLYFDDFWFAVPIRILFDNFEKLLGAQDNPGDSIDYTLPIMTSTTSTGYAEDSLHDFLGIPPGIPDVDHLSLFHRAYAACYNQWFRDENLQDSVVADTGAGPDDPDDYTLLKRGKRHDYFTSALPWPQKQNTAVTLPLGTSATIHVNEPSGDHMSIYSDVEDELRLLDTSTSNLKVGASAATATAMYADLSTATAATINAMRLAVTTQQFLERDARGGTRINEIVLSHFGVRSLDSRVQIPEYLGGSTQPVGITTIPQNSQTDTTPQGTLAAMGTINSKSGWTKSFTEWMVVIGIGNIRADLTYQQGLHRFFNLSTRYDLFWPEFQNIGEQAALQSEIELTDPAGGTNDDVWGYTERYAEFKYQPSRISSVFRSGHSATLDPWHLSEELSSPALDDTFIVSNTPMARVEAIPSQPDFILDCYFDLNHVRPMQMYGEPGLARF